LVNSGQNGANWVKEPHWWTRDQTNTKIQQYCLKYTNASKTIQRSVSASTSVPKKSNLIFGDASASTFWEFGRSKNLNTPTIPSQIHALLPHARLIVVFRNPTERCLSEYSYFIQNPNDLSATAFTELSLLRISNFNNCVSKVKNQNKASGTKYDEVIECMYFRHEELYYDQGTSNVNKKLSGGNVRLEVGVYSRPLSYWWSLYGKTQLLVLRSDDLLSNPLQTLKLTFQHLKVKMFDDTTVLSFIDNVNNNNKANKRSTARKLNMPPQARKALDMFYAPFNEELVKMTNNKGFSWT
jgi:hypothetical protein